MFQLTYNIKAIKVPVDFSREVLKARDLGIIYFQLWKEVIANLDYCHLVKLSFRIKRKIKALQDKQKLKQLMFTK